MLIENKYQCNECGHIEFDERPPEDCDLNCIITGCYGVMEVVGHRTHIGSKYGD